MNKQLLKISEQIETLAERIATLPKGVDESVFYQQMIKLQAAKAELEVKAKENPKKFDFDSPVGAKNLKCARGANQQNAKDRLRLLSACF